MAKDIKKFVSTCHSCQEMKRRYQKKQYGMMEPIRVGNAFDRIGIDIIGPLPKTKSSNQYIVVASDYLTKFAVLWPFRQATAAKIADFITNQIVRNFGCPRTILSDRGVQFTSKIVKGLTTNLNIHQQFTTPYHPQTDGLVERLNGTIEQMMTHYISENHNDWDKILPFCQLA